MLGASHECKLGIGIGRSAYYARLRHVYLRSGSAHQSVGFKPNPLNCFD